VRPWESRVPSATISPRKDQNKRSSKVKKDKKSSTTSKQPVSVKTPSASAKGTKPLGNPKGTAKTRRRLSYPATEKKTVQEGKQ